MAGSVGWSSAFEHCADVPTKASLGRLGPASALLSALRKQLNRIKPAVFQKKNKELTIIIKKIYVISSFIVPAPLCALA